MTSTITLPNPPPSLKAESKNLDFGDLRYAVGPGIRYQTPIGPARFDVGYQLNPIEGLLINGEPQKRRIRFQSYVP